MPGKRSDRPPADGARGTRRRLPWRWSRDDRRGLRPPTDPAYERSDAAEQERLIAEALEKLRDIDVREVMTPRLDVAALSIPVSATDVANAVRESGHSAFPVVNGGLDDVVGVLYVNDLFRSRRSAKAGLLASVPGPPTSAGAAVGTGEPAGPAIAGLTPIDVSRRIRQAYVIPESRPILAALVEMRRHRRGFAVVVDEYGGVAGVLTVKDLLEPIVGDLHDELDPDEEPAIVRVDGSRWLIDGRVNVDEVHDRLGIDIPEGDYVTVGGYLLDGFGHIPEEGETLVTGRWELAVQEMEKRRIAQVIARRLEDGEDTSSGGTDEGTSRAGADPTGRRPSGAAASRPGTAAPPSPPSPSTTGAPDGADTAPTNGTVPTDRRAPASGAPPGGRRALD